MISQSSPLRAGINREMSMVTAAEIVASYRSGSIRPVQSIRRCSERIRALADPGIFINLRDEDAKAFRAARSSAGLARTLSKTVITTYGHDFAVTSTLFHRSPARIGRQMQVWVRFQRGWRVVAAHVSEIATML